MAQSNRISLLQALPFYLVFFNIPVIVMVTEANGWNILWGFLYFFVVFTLGDRVFGINRENLDPQTESSQLFWYLTVTRIWPFAQAALIIYVLYKLRDHQTYNFWERGSIMLLTGFSSGIAGIVIAHELIHQRNKFERTLGDILLSMVNYGYFRTEHILGHHRYVATPRDPVTARYNEGLYMFMTRAIPQSVRSAWRIEKGRLVQKGKPIWHISNPFYLYTTLAALWWLIAYLIGGWHGVMQFALQCMTAIFILEITNYIEHYGLVRMHLGNGKYEHVQPRHSWNANHRITNYLMINLQRHSDHHYKPARRFPLLQALEETDAPQLPHGYIMMGLISLSPYHWRKLMNGRVRRWRSMYYPQITDWTEYNKGLTPWPK